MQAEMLPYMTTPNPYYFPAVIVLVLVLCLYRPRSTSLQGMPCQWHFNSVNTQGYSAVSLVVLKPHWHATFQDQKIVQRYHNKNLAFIFADPGDHILVPRPSHLQFLIACSMQKQREKAWESYHVIHCMTVICRTSSQQQSDVWVQFHILC